MRSDRPLPDLRWLEQAAAFVLIMAALLPRARDLTAPFDRGTCGFQGAFFALAAVNYERLGFEFGSGFPVLNLDVPLADDGAPQLDPQHAYVYPNHPPIVPWLAWSSARLLAADGWNEAWRTGAAPSGLEVALRLPFFAFHIVGLVAFWALLRRATGRGAALFGLAIFATVPIEIVYAALVDYEAPALCAVFLGLVAGLGYLRSGRQRELWSAALAFGLAVAITYGPLPFLIVLPWCGWRLGERRRAAALAGATGVFSVAALVTQGLYVRSAMSALGRPVDALETRARHLLEPLWDGTAPIGTWLVRQGTHALAYIGPALLCAAACAFLWRIAFQLRGPRQAVSTEKRSNIGIPLTIAGVAVLFAFYRHTLEPQYVFLLWVVPGLVALVAELVADLTTPLLRLRAGLAPFVVLAGLLVLPGLAGATRLRHELRAPLGDRSFGAAPELAGPAELGATIQGLVPPGRPVVAPAALGFNLAVSWYAWRTVLPAANAGAAAALANAVGIEAEPILLTPAEPPPSAQSAVEAFESDAHAHGYRSTESEGWRVWRSD